MVGARRPVLILGAGINGCALARELLLNEVPVCMVDRADIASGATAASSRLIHGGLRYLEYGEFDLVRESLAERTRLLRLAPHLVHPIRLAIPTRSRLGGLAGAALRFFGLRRSAGDGAPGGRGLALVRLGLHFYDVYARDPMLPRHSVVPVRSSPVAVDPARYRWLCTYYDAQVRYPERLTLALLADATALAASSGTALDVFTYHEARFDGQAVRIVSVDSPERVAREFQPLAIVNATGAWVDDSLERMNVHGPRLIGGTQGSHFVTFHAGLRDALAGNGLYAEAADGRPIFILPLGDATLVGTTDILWTGPPEKAVASRDEIDYLLGAVNEVFAGVKLAPSDISFHYSGVRPLPHVQVGAPSAVTRRHFVVKHEDARVPFYSIVGGKLTTCRSLAQSAVATILAATSIPRSATSEDRPLPGGEDYPTDEAAIQSRYEEIAARHSVGVESVKAIWKLHGTRTEAILQEARLQGGELLPGTALPLGFARWTIRNEHVRRLADLVERRLMLLYDQRLSHRSLAALAALMAEEGLLAPGDVASEVDRTVWRLEERYGKRVERN